MVERYGRDVPASVLNPVGQAAQLGAGEAARAAVGAELETARIQGGVLYRSGDSHEAPSPLRSLNPQSFGTPSQLQSERIWVARANQIRVVQARALAEFDETRAGLEEWFRQTVVGRMETILDAVARGEWDLPTENERRGPRANCLRLVFGDTPYLGWGNEKSISIPGPRERSDHGMEAYRRSGVVITDHGCVLASGGGEFRWQRCCYERRTQLASVWAAIEPDCPAAVAEILGIPETELPWQLRHWSAREPSRGNPILDRLDPADWQLTNPWRELRFRVYVATGRRAVNARRKALGLPPLPASA